MAVAEGKRGRGPWHGGQEAPGRRQVRETNGLRLNGKGEVAAEIWGGFRRQEPQPALSGKGGESQRSLGSRLDDGWVVAP